MSHLSNITFHDSRIISSIQRKIRAALWQQDNEIIRRILRQNHEITGKSEFGFEFRGKVFAPTEDARYASLSYKGKWPSLHESIWGQASNLLADQTQHDTRLRTMNQFLSNCVRGQQSDQGKRDSLPDLIASLGTEWALLPRDRPMSEVLSPKLWDDYLKFSEDIDFYSALPLMV